MGKTYNHHTTYNDFIRFSSYVHRLSTNCWFMYYCNLFTIVEGLGVSGRGGGEAVGGQ